MWRRIKYGMGRTWMKVFGWRFEGKMPETKKFVLIAAPHTSNWDLPFMLASAYILGIKISWLGKHTLFEGPFGWFMKALGGIPVDRRSPQGLVHQVVERFKQSDTLYLAVPPNGTRKKVEYWKSGFYHIARGAQVPILLSYLDFGTKTAGLGPLFTPTGNLRADMDQIREFYRGVRGKYPALDTVPRLREEETVSEVA
ncbi:lysophospholipid acyltransferase family protein [Stigmatella sp. ncwal1]|uniref:Lysophospholipid acyltransferase family protein n=1 Tax=Stigmatella ashevillensis TaxID=2995309 RepID=A0ABT5DL67_9BACT|nr:lysophospholipid acyltransferase family protein [Stigmatella ashevillena]MDC0714397.1 lysophospholipid acyltransferase family protein [Stigmatella ashevillena]